MDTHWLELKIPPLALVLLAAGCMWAVSAALPGWRIDLPGTTTTSIALGAAGVVIALLGVGAFRSAGTTVDPRAPDRTEHLVTTGIYRFTRNPMYLGMLLLLLAWGVYVRSVPALALVPAFVLYMNLFQIAPEERHMRGKFGDTFTRYQSRVRRWL
ncbi:MAG: isoprenylcysteine carboxylmethyltransferase family protein [Pseudomonadales bacterium]